MEAVMNIEGFRALGSDIFETVVNKSESVKETKKEKGEDLSAEGEEATHRGGEGVQVEAQADPGEADQVRDPDPGVHVPH